MERRSVLISSKKIRSGKSGKWPVFIVWFALVAGLGFIGPAMALWGDSLLIVEDADLGHINLYFSDIDNDWCDWGLKSIEIVDDGDHQDGRLKIESQDLRAGIFTGTWLGIAVWGFEYEITNNGSVPVKLGEIQSIQKDIGDGGILIDPNHRQHLDEELDPGESTTGIMTVTFWGPLGIGEHQCQFTLPYHQWNLNDPDAGWHDELAVEVVINVEKSNWGW
jgi:hypothetical protein